MREAIIIAVITGLLFFGGSGALTALAIRNATDSALWDIVLWSGIAGMLMSIVSLAIYISSQVYGRSFWMPMALINLGICLIVGGALWHLSQTAPPAKPSGPLSGLTNGQLRERTITLATALRGLETEYRNKTWGLNSINKLMSEKEKADAWERDTKESVRLTVELDGIWKQRHQSEAMLLLEELSRRVPYPAPNPYGIVPATATNPHSLPMPLRNGELTGMAPLSATADFLERMAKSLP